MNLYVQWFIIASEDVPNLCIELFINATGIESYFMKGVFMNFITYLAIYDCILACTLYMKYLWPAGKKNVKLWWSMDNIKVLVGIPINCEFWFILCHCPRVNILCHCPRVKPMEVYWKLWSCLVRKWWCSQSVY